MPHKPARSPGKGSALPDDFNAAMPFTPASIETKDQRVKLVYQVKLRITDSDASLKPGMPADVVLK